MKLMAQSHSTDSLRGVLIPEIAAIRAGRSKFRAAAVAALLSVAAGAQGEDRELEARLRELPSAPVQVIGVVSDSAAQKQAALKRRLDLNVLFRSLKSLEDLKAIGKDRISKAERDELERRFRERYPEKVLKEKRQEKKKAKK